MPETLYRLKGNARVVYSKPNRLRCAPQNLIQYTHDLYRHISGDINCTLLSAAYNFKCFSTFRLSWR